MVERTNIIAAGQIGSDDKHKLAGLQASFDVQRAEGITILFQKRIKAIPMAASDWRLRKEVEECAEPLLPRWPDFMRFLLRLHKGSIFHGRIS